MREMQELDTSLGCISEQDKCSGNRGDLVTTDHMLVIILFHVSRI